jgi:hypothetical protein
MRHNLLRSGSLSNALLTGARRLLEKDFPVAGRPQNTSHPSQLAAYPPILLRWQHPPHGRDNRTKAPDNNAHLVDAFRDVGERCTLVAQKTNSGTRGRFSADFLRPSRWGLGRTAGSIEPVAWRSCLQEAGSHAQPCCATRCARAQFREDATPSRRARLDHRV